jgi:hypothetical protein
MKNAIRIYNFLLRFYPRSYRETFGAQMMQTFSDQYEEVQASEGQVSIHFWLWTIADEIQNIVREQMSWLPQVNHFVKVSIGKLILSAVFLLPLYPIFVLVFIRTSLALPHPSVSGFSALFALAAVLLVLPGVASILVSYLLASTIAATFSSAKRARSRIS